VILIEGGDADHLSGKSPEMQRQRDEANMRKEQLRHQYVGFMKLGKRMGKDEQGRRMPHLPFLPRQFPRTNRTPQQRVKTGTSLLQKWLVALVDHRVANITDMCGTMVTWEQIAKSVLSFSACANGDIVDTAKCQSCIKLKEVEKRTPQFLGREMKKIVLGELGKAKEKISDPDVTLRDLFFSQAKNSKGIRLVKMSAVSKLKEDLKQAKVHVNMHIAPGPDDSLNPPKYIPDFLWDASIDLLPEMDRVEGCAGGTGGSAGSGAGAGAGSNWAQTLSDINTHLAPTPRSSTTPTPRTAMKQEHKQQLRDLLKKQISEIQRVTTEPMVSMSLCVV
jgi:hypothetical protein